VGTLKMVAILRFGLPYGKVCLRG